MKDLKMLIPVEVATATDSLRGKDLPLPPDLDSAHFEAVEEISSALPVEHMNAGITEVAAGFLLFVGFVLLVGLLLSPLAL